MGSSLPDLEPAPQTPTLGCSWGDYSRVSSHGPRRGRDPRKIVASERVHEGMEVTDTFPPHGRGRVEDRA